MERVSKFNNYYLVEIILEHEILLDFKRKEVIVNIATNSELRKMYVRAGF